MSQKQRVFFKFGAEYHTESIEILGDFNNWERGKIFLEDDDGDNVWWGTTELPSGQYYYKYLLDGKNYRIDHSKPIVKDETGNENNILLVGDALLGDNFIHNIDNIDFYAPDCFYMRAAMNKKLYNNSRLIIVIDDFIHSIKGVPLFEDEVYIYMLFKLSNGYTHANKLLYYFEISRIDGEFDYFGKSGIVDSEWAVDDFEFTRTNKLFFETPKWVRDAIFYQIFPERFYNGDPDISPKKTCEPNEPPKYDSFYDGDLEGIIKKLKHITELGANTLYLNPIFEAPSSHKYDTSDYQKIDPHFGDINTYEKLVKALKKNSMHLILDCVFNHTGTKFWAFKDIKKNKEKSKYIDWYFVKKFPLMEKGKPNYECWYDFPILPKLNVDNPEVREHLMTVARQWLESGANGWRLDVPNEIDHPFWKEFRNVVKSVNKDNYIVGEIWQNGKDWLHGDEFDAVMNYRFRDAVIEFFAKQKIDAQEFVKQIGHQLYDYPMQANFAMMNLLSSHDTARFFTVANKDIDKVKLAIAFQFTYLGAPSIYYGEEIGMEGDKDPDNRRFMIWEKRKWNKDLLQTYKTLIRLRNENEVLRHGEIRFLFANNMTFGFERFTEKESLYIFINNSPQKVKVNIPMYIGNGDFLDISINYELKRKKAYTLYGNTFAIIKKTRAK